MNIYLFCSGGFSTSLLAQNMKKEFQNQGYGDIDVQAFDYGSLEDVVDEADLVLLAPQIAWVKSDVEEEYPEKKVMVMEMQDFGSMDGSKMVEKVKGGLGI
ncbi:PTS sugar transporter subunit IIB [uncultured Dubosiella sp.]|uniref:PTS sugar transporter subunit IIB n=1 Tax=uncultured Dubosiella sp. TaxID=1937011 RepID=UPI0025B3ADAF|nr:PTS sugar transporter subunit IIB [uncultured Dubosiella sp.]